MIFDDYEYQYVNYYNDTEYMLMEPTYQSEPLITIQLLEVPIVPTVPTFTKEILELNIRDLNKYIKTNKLTEREIKSLKSERRRMLNRFYARNYRANKKKKYFIYQ